MFLSGLFLGIILCGFSIGLIAVDIITDKENERYNAELRALTHFRKIFAIENIIKRAYIEKTPSVIVVDKIKEVINDRKINK